jgi:L-2-hydroxyglutarate oxidase LhgO
VTASHDAAESAERDAAVVVVGAGVVGLAIAHRLAARHGVIVVERDESFARETSSHNTGIVHAGMFYVTGSLKHRLCLEGNRLMTDWCDAHSVRCARTGKLIVALDDGDLDGLDALMARAEANGVPGMSRVDGAGARALEPAVPAVAGLYSASSGVVDQWGYARSLEAAARERGALFAYRHAVRAAEREGDGFRLLLDDPDGAETTLRCGVLVNAAGHGAPGLATALGYPLDGANGVPPLRQRANKGRYYDFTRPELARAVSRPVYPIPPRAGTVLQHQASAGGLGLHLSVDIDGTAHLGPDTEWIADDAPRDYRADDTRRAAFVAAGRRLLPGLTAEDLVPGQVGYRPKLVGDGSAPPDFLIWPDRGYVHLGGIESPGLTSSLALADEALRALD